MSGYRFRACWGTGMYGFCVPGPAGTTGMVCTTLIYGILLFVIKVGFTCMALFVYSKCSMYRGGIVICFIKSARQVGTDA